MLITPAPGIHTAFMRFPIDALFLDRSMRVIDIVERLRPWRMASRRGQRACERRALPLDTLHRHLAAMGDQNLPHNIES